jgi:MFS family permease
VKGNSATNAGLKLIPLMLGIVSMSIFSGKRITTTGKYKKFPVMGTAIMTVGILLMATLTRTTPYWRLSIYAIIVGAGLGLSMQTIVIALQNAVDFHDMGVATSANTFFRSLGSVFGSAIFGAVLNNRLTHYMTNGFTALAQKNPSALTTFRPTPQGITDLVASPNKYPSVIHNTAMDAYVHAFHIVFFTAAPITALGFILALMLREIPLRTSVDYAAAREEAAGEAIG